MFKIYAYDLAPRGGECIYDSSLTYDRDRFIQKPELKLEANAAGSLKFTISPNMSGYGDLDILKSRLYVVQRNNKTKEDDIIWFGRVLEETRDKYNNRVIECEGALAFLNDTVQPNSIRKANAAGYYKAHFKTIIDFHNSLTSETEFDISRLMSRTNSYLDKINNELAPADLDLMWQTWTRSAESTLDILKEQYLNKWGGYFDLKYEMDDDFVIHIYLDYVDAYAKTPINQPVEYGLNIVSIEKTASADDFATALYPIGDSLDDYDKAWTIYKHSLGNYYRYFHHRPDDPVNPVYGDPEVYGDYGYATGQRIDPDTGLFAAINDDKYKMILFIPVKPGEHYFITSAMKGPPAVSEDGHLKADGAAMYCIYKEDQITPVDIGPSARNTIKKVEESDTEEEIVNIEYMIKQEIEIPEEGAYMTVCVYDPDSLYNKFEIKVNNPRYAEENYSIMSIKTHLPTDDDPISKPLSFPYGWDTYPNRTIDDAAYEAFFNSRIIIHSKLAGEFGFIIKTVDVKADSPDGVYNLSRRMLLRMTEKVSLEIVAVDLSYIDDRHSPFHLLDVANISSPPHGISEALPILSATIPLDSPENSEYTFANEVETRDGEPAYMSIYMSDMYKRGR